MTREVRRVWITWIALLLLAGLTFALSFLPHDPFATPVALGIATVKAVLVLAVFMEFLDAGATPRLAFIVSLILAAILATLATADVLTRQVTAVPPG
jgi:cytochrome c oxidase subunit 4